MLAETRLCRTADGRLVDETDPDAAELAYPVGASVSKADEQLLAAAATTEQRQPVDEPAPEPAPAPATKRRAKPADKSARPAGDK